jgi:hypothetical protein
MLNLWQLKRQSFFLQASAFSNRTVFVSYFDALLVLCASTNHHFCFVRDLPGSKRIDFDEIHPVMSLHFSNIVYIALEHNNILLFSIMQHVSALLQVIITNKST